MNKKTFFIASLTLLILYCFSGIEFNEGNATLEIIRVPDDYPTIQQAVDAATSGQIIMVAHGTYERVDIGKSLSLIGEGQAVTFINGSVKITANDVVVSGFNIQNASTGIYVYKSNNVTISNNTLTNNSDSAIDLWYSNNSKIINNNIVENYYGIELWETSNNLIINNTIVYNNADGVWLCESRNCTFRNNKIAGNSYNFNVFSLSLSDLVSLDIDPSNTVEGKPMYYWVNQQSKQIPTDAGYVAVINSTEIVVKDLTLTNNSDGILFAFTKNSIINNVTIMNGYTGIRLLHSDSNMIVGNTITNQRPRVGIGSGISFTYSNDNIIYHNNIANNERQVFFGAESHNNTWDNGYPSGGNFWSDYNGTDYYNGPHQNLTGSDGIGDTPYKIDEENADRYPLMTLYGLDLVPPTTISDYDGLWHNADFTITLTATDIGGTVAETYYKINNGPLKKVSIEGQPLINTENANNRLEYWSRDSNGNEETPHNILTNIKLDKTAPSIALISDASNETEIKTSTVTFEWSGSDELSGIDHYEVAIDDIWVNVEMDNFHAFRGVGDGSHTVEIKALDKAGNVRTLSVFFTINTSPIGGPGYIEEYAIAITLIALTVGVVIYTLKLRKKHSKPT